MEISYLLLWKAVLMSEITLNAKLFRQYITLMALWMRPGREM